MKLFRISFMDSSYDYEKLVVCKDEEEANKKLDEYIKELTGYSFHKNVREIKEIDGYKIQLIKIN